jgi:lipooligosaccharide transport system ATP-binding protein
MIATSQKGVDLTTHIVQAESVGKHFGSFAALSEFDLCVETGGCVGLLGPNGAGKSTFIGMLYGTIRRSSGTLSVFGLDPSRFSQQIKRRVGVVTQDNALDESLTVEENLRIYADFEGIKGSLAKSRIDRLLSYMNADHKRTASIKSLSGGMKRRLVFVRALLSEPQLLVLDEPTTGLDPAVRHLLWNRVQELNSQGTTILLTTHYMHEAEALCDRIVIMSQGRAIAQGRPRVLIQEHTPGFVGQFSVNETTRETLQPFIESRTKAPSAAAFDQIPIAVDRMDEHSIVIRTTDFQALSAFSQKIGVEPLHMRPANLEDVFLKLTGQGLSDDA